MRLVHASGVCAGPSDAAQWRLERGRRAVHWRLRSLCLFAAQPFCFFWVSRRTPWRHTYTPWSLPDGRVDEEDGGAWRLTNASVSPTTAVMTLSGSASARTGVPRLPQSQACTDEW